MNRFTDEYIQYMYDYANKIANILTISSSVLMVCLHKDSESLTIVIDTKDDSIRYSIHEVISQAYIKSSMYVGYTLLNVNDYDDFIIRHQIQDDAEIIYAKNVRRNNVC